jgi:hypothetical protein
VTETEDGDGDGVDATVFHKNKNTRFAPDYFVWLTRFRKFGSRRGCAFSEGARRGRPSHLARVLRALLRIVRTRFASSPRARSPRAGRAGP